MTAKNQLINELKFAITNDEKTLEQSLLTIYNFQTNSEKQNLETTQDNKVGFSGADSWVLSKCAQHILNGNHLSGWYLEQSIKKMPKYAKQLLGTVSKVPNKDCPGCLKIFILINAGNDGIWECEVCGREIEWGT